MTSSAVAVSAKSTISKRRALRAVSCVDVDVDLAEQHLSALGIGPKDPVILACYPEDRKEHSRYVPARDLASDLPYDWAELTQQAAQADGRDWETVRGHLSKTMTKNLGFVPSPGGTAYRTRKEIYAVTVLVYEIDAVLTKEEQWDAWTRAGLPEPTLVVDTGNKSLHVYYLLDQPCGVEEGEHARARLSAAVELAHPGVPTDPNLHSAHQVLRLAGGIHPKTGNRTTIKLNTGKRYNLTALMALCPEVEAKESVAGGEFQVRPDDWLPAKDEWFPDFPIAGMAVPLEVALGPANRELLESGMDPDDDTRWTTLYRLGKSVRAARLHLESLGQEIEGGGDEAEIRLLIGFIEKSEIKGGNVEEALEKYWRPEPCGVSDLSDLGLKYKLRSRGLQFGFIQQPHPLGDWAESMSEWDWLVSAGKTVELVVFNALMRKADHEGRPITSYRRRFLRYDTSLGFYAPVTEHEMQKLMLEILPYAYTQNKSGTKFRRHIKASSARACTEYAALMLNATRMDIEPAIAFRNGTYLLDTGELVPHSPARRLTWAVNAEYVAGAECPPVMRGFIGSSFGAEWEPIIQIVLRYLVDPELKCTKLILIHGPSGSGKGTIERLIEKLFPPSCISVVTSGFADINHPDKIRQFVIGKRLLAFPDLQGKQFGVGTLYALTDGGMLTSRKLHESDVEDAEPFTGRVVLCSTQPPPVDDAGNGLTRRMLVLPTSRPAGQKPDHDLDEKLETELGLIVSWALRASRAAVKELLANGDTGGLLRQAGMDAEVAMDPIRNFANRCLVPMRSDYLPSSNELFDAYKAFCIEQNHKSGSQTTFTRKLSDAIPHLRTKRRSVPGSDSREKVAPTFFGFGIVDGLVPGPGMLSSINTNKYIENGYQALHDHRPEEPDVSVLCLQKNTTPDSNKPCPDSSECWPDS